VILAAALLVLVGAGLFVAGLLTGVSVLYWACVAACVVAAVLLIAARRTMPPAASAPAAERPEATAAVPAEPPAPAEPAAAELVAEPAAGATAATVTSAPPEPDGQEDPPAEEVEVTDLLLIVDLKDEVLVVDEHPRYHVAGCSWLGSRTTIPLPADEARTDGFTPCAVCSPDRTLAQRARERK
jgi:hypothetical protein